MISDEVEYSHSEITEREYIKSKGFVSELETNKAIRYVKYVKVGGGRIAYTITLNKSKSIYPYQVDLNVEYLNFKEVCDSHNLLDYNEYKLQKRSKVINKILDRSRFISISFCYYFFVHCLFIN